MLPSAVRVRIFGLDHAQGEAGDAREVGAVGQKRQDRRTPTTGATHQELCAAAGDLREQVIGMEGAVSEQQHVGAQF
ncbi:hypothetical protein [Streptomyces chartreusis]